MNTEETLQAKDLRIQVLEEQLTACKSDRKRLKKQLKLYVVMQRSELLNSFLDWQDEDNGMENDKEWNKKYLDRYLKTLL